jgi:hypothetical protein
MNKLNYYLIRTNQMNNKEMMLQLWELEYNE